MASPTSPKRLIELSGMVRWAVFDGRFEPDDQVRVPIGRALSFAWGSANVLGDFALKTLPCGCQRRFGRARVLCFPHAGLDD